MKQTKNIFNLDKIHKQNEEYLKEQEEIRKHGIEEMEKQTKKKGEVIELGEDGEEWLILGIKDLSKAIRIFHKYEIAEYELTKEELMPQGNFEYKNFIGMIKIDEGEYTKRYYFDKNVFCKECGQKRKFDEVTYGFYITT